MKIKNIVTVLLVTILLTSCAPATPSVPAVAPTTISATATDTKEAATEIPSSTPKPPTETPAPKPTTEILDYPDTMADFNATVNFEIENVVDIEIAPNVRIRRWTPGETANKEKIAIPTAIEYNVPAGSNKNSSIFFLLSDIVTNTGPYQISPITGKPARMPDSVIDSWFNDTLLPTSPYGEGTQNLNFLTGDTAEDVLHANQGPFTNPFLYFLDGDLANRMITFAKSGGTDVSVLANVSGIPYPVVYTFRIQGLAVGTTPDNP